MPTSQKVIDHFRDPCPWRIIEDAGGAFAMGSIGGALFAFGKSFRNSPQGDRLRGAFQGAFARSPVVGGNFAAWGMLFSTFECSLIQVRGREDAWNSIASGAGSAALLAARSGLRASLASGVFGGMFLALIEGVGIAMNRLQAESYRVA
jgi:hypothetical protein